MYLNGLAVPNGRLRLFSGGLDSGLLAWLLRERCCCYTVGFHVQDKKNKHQGSVFFDDS